MKKGKRRGNGTIIRERLRRMERMKRRMTEEGSMSVIKAEKEEERKKEKKTEEEKEK